MLDKRREGERKGGEWEREGESKRGRREGDRKRGERGREGDGKGRERKREGERGRKEGSVATVSLTLARSEAPASLSRL